MLFSLFSTTEALYRCNLKTQIPKSIPIKILDMSDHLISSAADIRSTVEEGLDRVANEESIHCSRHTTTGPGRLNSIHNVLSYGLF